MDRDCCQASPGVVTRRRKLLFILPIALIPILLYYAHISLSSSMLVKHNDMHLLGCKSQWLQHNIANLPIASCNKNISLSSSCDEKNNMIQCPAEPPSLVGLVKVNKNPPTLEEQERAHLELSVGGHYTPENCTGRHKVAIVIPYRDRESNLATLVHHLHPFLQRQMIEYNIYVVEQAGNYSFNRGMLMNVGVLEALNQYPFDCLILHDVDLLPENDHNFYTCSESPRHMSVGIDVHKYKLLYSTNFGGVSGIATNQFLRINGFSNEFWGWGGEDDDIYRRLKHKGLQVSRYPKEVSRYTKLPHKKAKPSKYRMKKLKEGEKRYDWDGLSNIKYTVLKVVASRLFTHILVALSRSDTSSQPKVH